VTRALLCTLLCFALPSIAMTQTPIQTPTPDPQRHEFVIHNFKTESGAVLPEARIVYGTYGTLNADASNAVLLPSHYMANLNGYGFLIKNEKFPEGALDPAKLFLVTSELFGNGRSSSPSNTPEPFHGPRFPVMTIRDNVNAVHQLLTEELHIQHLKAVIGFSMGAQQAFQWAVSYPTYMDRIVATSGTAKTYGHGIVRLEGQIAALTADPTWNNGLRHGLGRLAVFAGVVAQGALAHRLRARHHLRAVHVQLPQALQRRRQQLHPAGPHLGVERRRPHTRLQRRRRKGARVDQGARALHALRHRPLLPT
jgi:pimeloyl-ACP methyl ester carboxylesterase